MKSLKEGFCTRLVWTSTRTVTAINASLNPQFYLPSCHSVNALMWLELKMLTYHVVILHKSSLTVRPYPSPPQPLICELVWPSLDLWSPHQKPVQNLLASAQAFPNSLSDAEELVHAFFSSRLDFCNSSITGITGKNIKKLQNIQKSSARILIYEDITPTLHTLAPLSLIPDWLQSHLYLIYI